MLVVDGKRFCKVHRYINERWLGMCIDPQVEGCLTESGESVWVLVKVEPRV